MRTTILALLAACTGGPTVPPIAADPPPAPLPADAGVAASYTVSFRGAAAQYLEVEAVFPATGDRLDLFVAAWTPGSYRIRDFAQHLEGVRATTPEGVPLAIRKTDIHRWEIDTAGAGDVVVRYEVYADGSTVRDNRVEADHAILNGAPTFLVAADRMGLPHDVRLQTPEAWPAVATALPDHPSGEARRYRAPNYDVLVDSPILAGDLTLHEWSIDGVPHRLATLGAPEGFPHDRAAADVEAVSRANIAFWGGMPYPSYTFLNVFNGQRGGLEHAASTLMFASADIQFDDDAWKRWLGLVSHEFFHTWNVKRLRPIELGPFDYERPVLTRSLWISEGLTTYYADLLLVRAGLLSETEWLTRMSGHIEKTERASGRYVRSLEQASEDAWIKYYQRDANHDNTSVDYYGKGAVVGFLLDARIRRDSRGWAGLDDAMRLAYSRHSAEQGFTPEAFQEACEEVASAPLADFFDGFVRGTADLDYQPALDLYGLRFAAAAKKELPTVDLGLSLAGSTVSAIQRDGPAWGADVIVGDELIAIDGRRVRDLAAVTRGVKPGAEVEVVLSRRDRLRTVRLRAAPSDDRSSKLTPVADASIKARSQRARLLDQARPGSPEARTQARAAVDEGSAGE